MSKKEKKAKGVLAIARRLNASPTLITASLAPFAAMGLKYKLDKKAEENRRKLDDRKRADHAKRIESIVSSRKKVSAHHFGSGGSSAILRKIDKLRSYLGVIKRNNANGIRLNGKTMKPQSIKIEIGKLQKRYNQRREQRMAMESGDINDVIEFITPRLNSRIKSFLKNKYSKAKSSVRRKIKKAGKDWGEGVGQSINKKKINKAVEDAARKAGEKFQEGAVSTRDPKRALKIAAMIAGGTTLAGAGGVIGAKYGKKGARALGLDDESNR